MRKVFKGFPTFFELVEKIEIIVLSRTLRNFNILGTISPFHIPWILQSYSTTCILFFFLTKTDSCSCTS